MADPEGGINGNFQQIIICTTQQNCFEEIGKRGGKGDFLFANFWGMRDCFSGVVF